MIQKCPLGSSHCVHTNRHHHIRIVYRFRVSGNRYLYRTLIKRTFDKIFAATVAIANIYFLCTGIKSRTHRGIRICHQSFPSSPVPLRFLFENIVNRIHTGNTLQVCHDQNIHLYDLR